MNYANPLYSQNPPYPGYPPQNYARPKKKNELWFVLAGVFLILNTLLNILPAFLSLLSYPNVENIALFVEQLVFLALGVCCIAFRKNHGVLAAFCIVLACIDLLLLVLYATIRIEYGFTMFIWAFMAALILVNARRSGRGVALLVIASLFVLLSTGLFVYECVYVISSYLLRSTSLTPWVGLTILSRLNMVFAQVFLIVAAFMPNKTPIRPNIPFQSNAPFGNAAAHAAVCTEHTAPIVHTHESSTLRAFSGTADTADTAVRAVLPDRYSTKCVGSANRAGSVKRTDSAKRTDSVKRVGSANHADRRSRAGFSVCRRADCSGRTDHTDCTDCTDCTDRTDSASRTDFPGFSCANGRCFRTAAELADLVGTGRDYRRRVHRAKKSAARFISDPQTAFAKPSRPCLTQGAGRFFLFGCSEGQNRENISQNPVVLSMM